jgi:peptidoglycan hydrolase-like protein with peptidoglycan-binding domain
VLHGIGFIATAALVGSSLAGAPAAAATTEVAAVPPPAAPAAAPAVVEEFAPYLPQVSCDPVAKPGTLSLRSTMMQAFGGRDLGITRSCSVGGLSEHKEGRAWDWGLDAANPAEKALADQFLAWLLAPGPGGGLAYNARRLGVMYVIYNGKIWGSYRAAEGWRKYTGGEAHGSHLHISLAWTGAMARSSWWTGTAVANDYGPCPSIEGQMAAKWSAPRDTPCPPPTSVMDLTESPLLQEGVTSPYVTQLQRLLSVTPVTGYFGPITKAAVVELQQKAGVPVTGTTTPETWQAARGQLVIAPPSPSLQPVTAPRSLPAKMTYRVRTGDSLSTIAARWRSTVDAIRSANGMTSDVLQVGQRVTVPVRSGLTRYTYKKLDRGDERRAVKVLQTALGMKKKYRTGFFGAITERKVNKFRAARGWATNGKVRVGVWRRLGA